MVCLDEMGPVSAKSYAGSEPVRTRPPTAGRAKQEIDYGRRGKGYVFGAFCPATGSVSTRAKADGASCTTSSAYAASRTASAAVARRR